MNLCYGDNFNVVTSCQYSDVCESFLEVPGSSEWNSKLYVMVLLQYLYQAKVLFSNTFCQHEKGPVILTLQNKNAVMKIRPFINLCVQECQTLLLCNICLSLNQY